MVEGVSENGGGGCPSEPVSHLPVGVRMCPSPPPRFLPQPFSLGVWGAGSGDAWPPSLITVVCPCPHRTPLEQDRVSLWDPGPLSAVTLGAGPGHGDLPASPSLAQPSGLQAPRECAPSTARSPYITISLRSGSDEPQSCREGLGSFQEGGAVAGDPLPLRVQGGPHSTSTVTWPCSPCAPCPHPPCFAPRDRNVAFSR